MKTAILLSLLALSPAQAAERYTPEQAQAKLRLTLKEIQGAGCDKWIADAVAAGVPPRAAAREASLDAGGMSDALRRRAAELEGEIEQAAVDPSRASFEDLGRKVADRWLLTEYSYLARLLYNDALDDEESQNERPQRLKSRRASVCVGFMLTGARIQAHEQARRGRNAQ